MFFEHQFLKQRKCAMSVVEDNCITIQELYLTCMYNVYVAYVNLINKKQS